MDSAGLSLLFLACAILIGALSVPLMLDKVPPNPLYGFRTTKTMSHPSIWYPANRYCGRQLLYAAAIQAAASILMLTLASRVSPTTAGIVLVVVMLGSVIAAAVHSLLYLRTLS